MLAKQNFSFLLQAGQPQQTNLSTRFYSWPGCSVCLRAPALPRQCGKVAKGSNREI